MSTKKYTKYTKYTTLQLQQKIEIKVILYATSHKMYDFMSKV